MMFVRQQGNTHEVRKESLFGKSKDGGENPKKATECMKHTETQKEHGK